MNNNTEITNGFKVIETIKGAMRYELNTFANFDIDNPTYKKLDDVKSHQVRKIYSAFIEQLKLNPESPLYTKSGIKIAEGFERIVVGDYGAYIEYDLSQVPKGYKYIYETGEEYRVLPNWRNRVKYIWYTTKEHDCKIYWQLRTVSYADYKRKKFYVSPYEIIQFQHKEQIIAPFSI